MQKMTKQQAKDMDRIHAWMNGQPFQENSRDKHPTVPIMPNFAYLEALYTPSSVTEFGKFYTPLNLVNRFWSDCGLHGHYLKGYVLDPCAGIGNLISPFFELSASVGKDTQVEAFDLDEEAIKICEMFSPFYVKCQRLSPFEHIHSIRGQFDLVLMNPPFGNTWGMGTAYDTFPKFGRNSLYLFMALGLEALKSGGVMCLLAPSNFLERMTKDVKAYFDNTCCLEMHEDYSDYPFRYTGIKVHGYQMIRNSNYYLGPIITKEGDYVIPTADKLLDVSPTCVFQAPPEPPAEPVYNLRAQLVSKKVYAELKDVEPIVPIKDMVIRLNKLGKFVAADWVKRNPFQYGQGYYNGFRPSESE